MSTTPARVEGPQRVAAYATIDGASKAVTHLVELGHDETEVRIAPRDFHVTRDRSLLRRLGTGLRLGALGGAAVACVVGLASIVGFGQVVDTLIPGIIVGGAVGLGAGAALAVITQLVESRRSFGPPAELLVPSRYDVLVMADQRDANHELARWWDPEASPAELRRSA